MCSKNWNCADVGRMRSNKKVKTANSCMLGLSEQWIGSQRGANRLRLEKVLQELEVM